MKKNLILLLFLLFSLPKLWAEDEPCYITVCYGETYDIDSTDCSEVYITVLPENPIIHESATICSGEVYEWYGEIYWESGEYSITLPDNFGCEQITILHLTVKSNLVRLRVTTATKCTM